MNNTQDYYSLSDAYYNDDLDTIKKHLSNGASVNSHNEEGDTIMHTICDIFCNVDFSIKVLDLLIGKKADINVTNNKGYTPLDTAKETSAKREINHNLNALISKLKKHGAKAIKTDSIQIHQAECAELLLLEEGRLI